MEYILITVLAVACAFVVVHPMVTKKKYRLDFEDVFAAGDVKQLNYLNAKKASILENLKELEFEYEMGKLSDEDYSNLREDYLAEAQEVVRAIDRLKVREEIEVLIEGDVRRRRRIR